MSIWVPNFGSNVVTVVRASTGAVLATLTGNGLNGPFTAAFDGERIIVTTSPGAASRCGRRPTSAHLARLAQAQAPFRLEPAATDSISG